MDTLKKVAEETAESSKKKGKKRKKFQSSIEKSVLPPMSKAERKAMDLRYEISSAKSKLEKAREHFFAFKNLASNPTMSGRFSPVELDAFKAAQADWDSKVSKAANELKALEDKQAKKSAQSKPKS